MIIWPGLHSFDIQMQADVIVDGRTATYILIIMIVKMLIVFIVTYFF